MIWCQGYSEPGAGSDLASINTRAIEDGDDFLISGQKIWTSTAAQADMIFCLVRTEPQAQKHAGISYLIFPMKTPGIEVRPLTTMTGASEFNEVFFTDVRVPQSQIVGARGEGWRVANTTLKHERGMLGDPNATEARLGAIIALMGEERAGGERLIDNPAMLDRLMRLQGRVLAMKCNGLRLLSAQLAGEGAGLAALIVKLQGCEINHQLAALAIDVLGELGVLYGQSPHLRAGGSWQQRYMFDLGLIIGGGTAQIQKNIIAERGLGLPREPKPARVYAMEFALSVDQRLMQESLSVALGRLAPLARVRAFASGDEPVAADNIWRALPDRVRAAWAADCGGAWRVGRQPARRRSDGRDPGRPRHPGAVPSLGGAVPARHRPRRLERGEVRLAASSCAAGEALAGVALAEALGPSRDGAAVPWPRLAGCRACRSLRSTSSPQAS